MASVVINLVVSLLILVWLYSRGGTRNVVTCVAGVLAFFAFGPLVNFVNGASVYRGIVVDQLGQPSTGFTLALAGLMVPDRLLAPRDTFVPG